MAASILHTMRFFSDGKNQVIKKFEVFSVEVEMTMSKIKRIFIFSASNMTFFRYQDT